MKTKIFTVLFVLISQFTVTACNDNAKMLSEELRTLENFTNVDAKGSINVFLKQGDVQEIRIEAEEMTLPKISTVVKNGTLMISSEGEIEHDVNIYLTFKNLEGAELSGSGSMSMLNQFKNDDMSFQVSGSGNMNVLVDAKSIKMLMTGSGNITAKGRSADADIRINSSGNIDGKELRTFTSSVNIIGSGTSTVDVNNELTVNITGSGNVFYLTDPERIHSKINGSGRIEKINS